MTPTLAELYLLAAVDRDDPHVCRLAPRCAACGGCFEHCRHGLYQQVVGANPLAVTDRLPSRS